MECPCRSGILETSGLLSHPSVTTRRAIQVEEANDLAAKMEVLVDTTQGLQHEKRQAQVAIAELTEERDSLREQLQVRAVRFVFVFLLWLIAPFFFPLFCCRRLTLTATAIAQLFMGSDLATSDVAEAMALVRQRREGKRLASVGTGDLGFVRPVTGVGAGHVEEANALLVRDLEKVLLTRGARGTGVGWGWGLVSVSVCLGR